MYILAFLGLVSGTISGIAYENWGDAWGYSPGIFFGLFISLYFLAKNYSGKNLLKSLLWVGASFLSFVVAFGITIRAVVTTPLLLSYPFSTMTGYFIGGTTGGFLVMLTFSFLIRRLSFSQIIMLGILGGALGAICVYMDPSGSNDGDVRMQLFIIWQTVMATALGIILRKKDDKLLSELPAST